MGKYDVSFWIAQGLSLVSLGIYVFSWSQKEYKKILRFQASGNLFNISSLIFLGAYSGVLMSTITFTRNVIYSFESIIKWVKNPLTMYLFMFILILGLIPVWKGPISILPCLSCILGTYSVSCKDIQKFRTCMFLACVLWIPYNLWVLAYVGVFSNVVMCISIWIALQKEKERKEKINQNSYDLL